ncbi:DUF1643 domain-containing protein [Sporolactobacillus putidus]|uniref:DUF1643 domain-containing protein n=1 Tax=Sporolactobacillus putidus TaxID=492735 RepID=A0A917S617_9BACL|nr:DUF1643 domain-containing protein [Sporolactobacillus putidus]GGL57178.1 hypothetical protein GCM10007968_21500 [Sporolactobacillus putidus]
MKWKEATVHCQAAFSDDEKYRYLLTKTWDADKPIAAVLMLNPSTAEEIKLDRTIMNLTNYLVDHGFGTLSVINLFAYRSTDPSKLNQAKQDQGQVNDQFILSTCSAADMVIIGWTRNGNINRKRQVASLLAHLSCTFKCFRDKEGVFPRHPSLLNPSWELIDYDFTFIEREH